MGGIGFQSNGGSDPFNAIQACNGTGIFDCDALTRMFFLFGDITMNLVTFNPI